MNFEPVNSETDQKLRDNGYTSVLGRDDKYVKLNEHGNREYIWASGDTIQTQYSANPQKLD